MATLKDIARHLGISISTASLALRDHGSISIETKQRVWEAKEALGYRAPLRPPGAIARRRKKQSGQSAETRDVAFLLVSRDFEDPRYAPTFQQIAAYVAERHWRPIFVTCPMRDLEEGVIPPLLKNGGVDGIIVSGDYTPDAHQHLRKLGIPMVMLGRFVLGDDPWMSCEPDFSHGVRLFVNRMSELGHRRYGLVIDGSYSDTFSTHLRTAYEATVITKGAENIGIAATQYRRKGEFLTLPGLLKRGPTALLLGSVFQAQETYEACHKAGLSIPGQISIVSFGSGRTCVAAPSLTYLEQQPGVALRVVEKLADALDHPERAQTREMFPRRFVAGGSIGPCHSL